MFGSELRQAVEKELLEVARAIRRAFPEAGERAGGLDQAGLSGEDREGIIDRWTNQVDRTVIDQKAEIDRQMDS